MVSVPNKLHANKNSMYPTAIYCSLLLCFTWFFIRLLRTRSIVFCFRSFLSWFQTLRPACAEWTTKVDGCFGQRSYCRLAFIRILKKEFNYFKFPLAIYFGLYHQKAPGELVTYLNQQLDTNKESPILISQLLPCYSMPQYAAIHPHGLDRAHFRMLDCTPQFDKVRSSKS